VWTGISKVPYGDTWTLETLVESVGYKQGSSTYVSAAINRNRFAIVIPSHRITPAKGKGKYVGGTANKDFLLTLESKHRSTP
jgi:O-6-methylguanine DNA methyltransferase